MLHNGKDDASYHNLIICMYGHGFTFRPGVAWCNSVIFRTKPDRGKRNWLTKISKFGDCAN